MQRNEGCLAKWAVVSDVAAQLIGLLLMSIMSTRMLWYLTMNLLTSGFPS